MNTSLETKYDLGAKRTQTFIDELNNAYKEAVSSNTAKKILLLEKDNSQLREEVRSCAKYIKELQERIKYLKEGK